MESEKNKHYKLLKNMHIFPSLAGLIVTFVVVVILAGLICQFLVLYLVDSKLETEYKSISFMAALYDKAEDKDAVHEALSEEGRDYLIVDNNNTVLYSKGENTCSFSGGNTSSSGIKQDITVYLDNECDCIDYSDEDGLKVSVIKAIPIVNKHVSFKKFFNSDEEDINIPLSFWISVKLGDGSQSFVGKAAFEVKSREVVGVYIVLILVAFILIIFFISRMVRIFKKFKRQKQVMSVFFTDVITKGHNWMWFTIKGEQLLQKKRNDKLNYAVLNILFVKYNTFCLCHSVEDGEQILQSINRTISKTLNKNESVARQGTASFAVFMQYPNEDVLKKRVKLLLRHLENVESDHKFGFHVGIALLPATEIGEGKFARRTDVNLEKVYNDACAARATLEGSDDSAIAFFDNKLVEEQKWIDTVHENQKAALENEEFVIYYQPKYNPVNDQLSGAEALIRWQSPKYGFVTPGRIIPIFEKNGFITEIDHYMITHVARDQKRWLDAGYKCVPVSVNVSRAHFIESDLAEQIRDAVDKEGAPRELIEIELTESAFFDDKKALVTTIEKLKSYGFSVSMDDFGAGYSSLNSLKDMPLDVLKLDADFFRGESEGNRGEIVVSEAIRLAKSLNMRTVAEGVEVREQVDFLARQGCDMIQGYYYAKPMPGSDYEERMRASKAPQALELSLEQKEETVENPEVVETAENIEAAVEEISENAGNPEIVQGEMFDNNSVTEEIPEILYEENPVEAENTELSQGENSQETDNSGTLQEGNPTEAEITGDSKDETPAEAENPEILPEETTLDT